MVSLISFSFFVINFSKYISIFEKTKLNFFLKDVIYF
jgi:hypothetical protein